MTIYFNYSATMKTIYLAITNYDVYFSNELHEN
jgi:hypothetical protein